MTVAKGTSLGPYEIVSRIGAGGMGEVWRARDRRIGRDVAVKVLPETFNDDAVRRFEQEARAAGALNHPGLVTIFDVGTTDGSPYIVMELLEGQTLRDVIGGEAPPALPLRKALDYAAQIASALAAAHEKGIIHRDLKPENIFITSGGRVKIFDFGLAKLAEETREIDPNAQTAPRPRRLTSEGGIVGTPAYMSPEQVRAQTIDPRTDIFSLGAVSYEMLSGHPAFECGSTVETMHAVLTVDPPLLTTIDASIPPAIAAIVSHCLEKDSRERFQSARDLAFELRMQADIRTSVTDSGGPPPPQSKPLPYRVAIAGLALLAAGAGGFLLSRLRGAESHRSPRTFRQLTFGGAEIFPTLAPDGKSFAYVSAQSGNRDIYVQRVDGRGAINITSDSPDDDSEPAFSPDGSQIAFRSERGGGGIFAMGVTGESVRRLADAGHNPAWSPDGTRIVFSSLAMALRPHVHPDKGNLWIVDAHTGAKRLLLDTSEPGVDSDAMQPSWSPHGKRIAFWGFSNMSGERQIWTIDPEAPQPKRTIIRVTSDSSLHWNPVWSADGRHLYFGSNRDGTLNLWRVAMDESTGKPAGAPEPLSLPAAVSGNFTFSHQEDIAFCVVSRSYRLLAYPFDMKSGKTGAARPLFGGSQEILSFAPSPDGREIAFTSAGGAQEDLFVANADGTRLRQLTNDAARDRGVAWSSDGKTLYVYSNRSGGYQIWSIHADGSGLTPVTNERDLKSAGASNIYLPNASHDGRMLAAQTDRSGVFVHLGRPIGQRLETFAGRLIVAPKWSPDDTRLVGELDLPSGRSIVVYSLQSRRLETVLNHGRSPQWLPDGRHIAFFEKQGIGILDLESRRVTTNDAGPRELDQAIPPPRLSRDGSTLYVQQAMEQADIWMVQLGKD